MAANVFKTGGGNVWGNVNSWSLGSIPTGADGNVATFNGTSPACNIDTTTRICNAIDFTGYTNTITFSQHLTVNGNITLGLSMSFAGSGNLVVNAASTLTGNGVTCQQTLNLALAVTYTFSGNWVNNAPLIIQANCTLTGTGTLQATSFNNASATLVVTLSTNVIITGTSQNSFLTTLNGASNTWSTAGWTSTFGVSGTATIQLTGGTWSASQSWNINVTIQGNITMGSVTYASSGTPTLTYTSGTVTLSGSPTLTISGNCTINCTGLSTSNFFGLLSISGSVTISGTGLYCNGITTGGVLSGSITVFLVGGTWTSSGNSCNVNLTIVGNVTFAASVLFGNSGTPTLTYISGTPVVSGSTLTLGASCTLNTAGMSFNNLTITNAVGTTITNNSLLTINGTLTVPASNAIVFAGTGGITIPNLTLPAFAATFSSTLSCTNLTLASSTYTFNGLLTVSGTLNLPNGSITFAGSAGFNVANLLATTIAGVYTCTLSAGVTYTVTASISITTTAVANTYTLASSSGSVLAILTLGHSATQSLAYVVNATRIDSSNGQTIYTVKGTITSSNNWTNTLGYGNIVNPLNNASLHISGVTYNKSGLILGSVLVYLFQDNGNNTATFIAATTSNAGTGAYSFTVYPGSTYFAVAFGTYLAVDVFDTTDRILTAA